MAGTARCAVTARKPRGTFGVKRPTTPVAPLNTARSRRGAPSLPENNCPKRPLHHTGTQTRAMSDEIKFSCLVCGQHIACDVTESGRPMLCPACGANLTVPHLMSETLPPPVLNPGE